MGSAKRVRSRAYWIVEEATNSSTSGNGSGGAMYMAWRVEGLGNGFDAGRGGCCSGCGRSSGSGDDLGGCVCVGDGDEKSGVAGKQAKINISRTRQSFPPLYAIESSSGLFYKFWVNVSQR